MAYTLVHDVPADREGYGVPAGALVRAPAGSLVRVAVCPAHQVQRRPPGQDRGEVAND